MEKKRLKLGILAQYLDTRSDLRVIISEMALQFDVTLYLKKSDLRFQKFFGGNVKSDVIIEKNNKYLHYFITLVYKLFGRIPRSRNNYFVTEHFKITNSLFKPIHRFIENCILNIARITPKFISYDKFLALLSGSNTKSVKEQDAFLCFTHIYQDAIFKDILASGKKVFVYVYSWDHPCKMKCFSKNPNVHYLVWSNDLQNDLIQLQGISLENIHILGSTQFIYLHNYISNKISQNLVPSENKNIYIPMATGTHTLAPEEVEVYRRIAEKIYAMDPKINIIVRPYPFLKNRATYQSLELLPNVKMEEVPSENPVDQAFSEDLISKKYTEIAAAALVMHCGTTLGLEASYLNVPVLFIDLGKKLKFNSLHNFIHQYQNDKYLNLKGYQNVCTSFEDVERSVKTAIQNREALLAYNQECKKVAEVQSLPAITARLKSLIEEGVNGN